MIFLKELNRFPNRKITIHRFNLIAMNHNIFYILIIKFENILNHLCFRRQNIALFGALVNHGKNLFFGNIIRITALLRIRTGNQMCDF